MSESENARIPVTIVTGFLGAGKTTLVNHMLTNGGLGRVAALVNDFGAIDVDAELVASVADEVVTLRNGCVCCTINGDLYRAANQVLAVSPPIDRIVVETTGVADPLPVGLTFLETDLRVRTSLETVVTVVDVANFALDLFKADAAMAQIVHGDVIVLNKTDLADEATIASVRSRITALKPRARIIESAFSRVAADVIIAGFDELAVSAAGRDHHDHHHHGHLAADGFVAHAVQFDAPLSATVFQRWLDHGLPPEVFRAKGIVRFDKPDGRFVFQYCAGRCAFDPYDGPVEESRLVFIGQNLDSAAIDRDLALCRAQARDAA